MGPLFRPVLHTLTHPSEAAAWTARQRRNGKRIVFVPTMGALHEGHLALMKAARDHGEAVAASVFVNPLQFNDPNDLARYPRQPDEDRRKLAGAGVDMVLMPAAGDLFKGFNSRHYDLGGLDKLLEGASRPGHFQGVVNVVERLFHFVRPDVALFGEKDRQQLAVIRRAAHVERWPVAIVGHPIIRDADGLALSSRNQRLSPAERQQALVLFKALSAIRRAAFKGSVAQALNVGWQELARESAVVPDYLTVVDPATFQPLGDWEGVAEAVVLTAVQVGPVRLIDNMAVHR